MGRDVAGIRKSNKPAVVNFIPNDAVNNASNSISLERVETKDSKAEEVGDCGEKQDVVLSSVKSMNCNAEMHEDKPVKAETLSSSHNKLSSPVKPPVLESQSTAANHDKNPIVSNPSDHANATDTTVDAASNFSMNSNDLESPMTANKPLQQQQEVDDPRKYDDEEDNCSLSTSSSSGSVRSTNSTKFKVTVPVAPTFRSEERAAKRKEFHMKLEEKHKALEAEKLEQAARAKEVEEAAIRELRKSMVYKANPVPSFYREGSPAPPKPAGLKKLPVTRAKSPNLARRKSCSDVFIAYPEEKKGCAKARHSIGSYTEGSSSVSISPVAPKNKERVVGKSGNGGVMRVKGRAKSVKETKEIPLEEEIKESPVEAMKESSPVEEAKESSPVEEMKEPSPVEETKESSSPVKETKESSSPVKEMQQNSAE